MVKGVSTCSIINNDTYIQLVFFMDNSRNSIREIAKGFRSIQSDDIERYCGRNPSDECKQEAVSAHLNGFLDQLAVAGTCGDIEDDREKQACQENILQSKDDDSIFAFVRSGCGFCDNFKSELGFVQDNGLLDRTVDVIDCSDPENRDVCQDVTAFPTFGRSDV